MDVHVDYFHELIKQEWGYSCYKNEFDDAQLDIKAANSDVAGSIRYISDIDKLADHPEVKSVRIFALDQDTFEYFINKYGRQLRYIHFYSNKSVEDWSLLGTLPDLECVNWFHNQKIDRLWDMSRNYSLKALKISDFSKLHSISGIEKAPALEWVEFGDAIWRTSEIESLKPLENTGIRRINFSGKKISDMDVSCIPNMKKLEVFDCPTNLFTTEEIAWIVAKCPGLEGYALRPYLDYMIYNEKTHKADIPGVMIIGKRKPTFAIEGNEKKLEKYVSQFDSLVDKYRTE